MNRKRKINRKYMQMQTVGVFLLTLVVVLAVTWEINLNQVKRETEGILYSGVDGEPGGVSVE